MKPRAGKHPVKCFKCKKIFAEVMHYGSDNPKKSCKYCEEMKHLCPVCFRLQDAFRTLDWHQIRIDLEATMIPTQVIMGRGWI